MRGFLDFRLMYVCGCSEFFNYAKIIRASESELVLKSFGFCIQKISIFGYENFGKFLALQGGPEK